MAHSLAQLPSADDPAGGSSEESPFARRRRDDRLALVATAILFLILLAPPPPDDGAPTRWGELPEGTDKVVHAALFAVETRLLDRALRHRRPASRRRVASFLPVAGLALTLAVATEALQAFVPGRTADPADFAADALGVAVGGLFAIRASSSSPSPPANSLRAAHPRIGASSRAAGRDAPPNSSI